MGAIGVLIALDNQCFAWHAVGNTIGHCHFIELSNGLVASLRNHLWHWYGIFAQNNIAHLLTIDRLATLYILVTMDISVPRLMRKKKMLWLPVHTTHKDHCIKAIMKSCPMMIRHGQTPNESLCTFILLPPLIIWQLWTYLEFTSSPFDIVTVWMPMITICNCSVPDCFQQPFTNLGPYSPSESLTTSSVTIWNVEHPGWITVASSDTLHQMSFLMQSQYVWMYMANIFPTHC